MRGSDPVFSVSEFVAVFNQSLEAMYPQVGIAGELANFRVSKGKWVFFDLKDEDSSVKFFGTVYNLPGPLEEGMNLEVAGSPRLHPRYGFSVNISHIKVVGEGSIARAKKLLAEKLKKEGLFSEDRKRALPYPPRRLGLITSVESAGYSDFIKILDSRWGNMEVQLVDCTIQGDEAPQQIVSAIEYFNQAANPPEVLAIVRGGGSADDLAVFDIEQVVRSVASSRVPTIVAVGHERDVSMAEMAADKRASTPSNAAELLVPDRKSEQAALQVAAKQLHGSISRIINTKAEELKTTKERIDSAILDRIDSEEKDLRQKRSLLWALDPNAPLKRGFVLARDNRGQLLNSIKRIKIDDKLSLELSDGEAGVKVLSKKEKYGQGR